MSPGCDMSPAVITYRLVLTDIPTGGGRFAAILDTPSLGGDEGLEEGCQEAD